MPPDPPIYAWTLGPSLLHPSTFYFLPTSLDCVIQQAINDTALSLGYESVHKIKAKATSSVVRMCFSLHTPAQESLSVSLLYHWSLIVSLATNKAPRQV